MYEESVKWKLETEVNLIPEKLFYKKDVKLNIYREFKGKFYLTIYTFIKKDTYL